MTQESKDLLLKDLCARLPYNIKANINNNIEILDSICDDDGFYFNCIPPNEGVNIDIIKPYLFPLSSMTEEQKQDMIKSSVGIGSDKNVFDWYNKNHFDYRGLIEKGLAIDATNLNIY